MNGRPGSIAASSSASDAGPLALLGAFTVVCLAPFLEKAFHMDDPLFLWVARRILTHPLDPYGFEANWFGRFAPMHEVSFNPPLASYFIALVTKLAGGSEVVLHGAFLLPAVACVTGTYVVARRLAAPPVVAAALLLASPGFLVSATSVMADVPMLALWVWALAFWIRGIDAESRSALFAAALLASACLLTKLNGATLLPLLALYAAARRRPLSLWAMPLALPVLAIGIYFHLVGSLYGAALWEGITAANASLEGSAWADLPRRALVTISFAGGAFVAGLLVAPVLWRGAGAVAFLLAAAAGAFAPVGEAGLAADRATAVQLSLFAFGGASVVALAAVDLARRGDAASLLLAAWTLGTVAFGIFGSWFASVRYLLPLVPAAAILAARSLQGAGTRPLQRIAPAWIVSSLVVALLVARADYLLAASARTAARATLERVGDARGGVWYQGHWGFQYYMDARGARAVDFELSRLAPGDVIVVPLNNTNVFPVDPAWVVASETVELEASSWLTTMGAQNGAGFYSSVFGPLPFAFGAVPRESYLVLTLGDG